MCYDKELVFFPFLNFETDQKFKIFSDSVLFSGADMVTIVIIRNGYHLDYDEGISSFYSFILFRGGLLHEPSVLS